MNISTIKQNFLKWKFGGQCEFFGLLDCPFVTLFEDKIDPLTYQIFYLVCCPLRKSVILEASLSTFGC